MANGLDILLVEDNPGDVRLLREAFAEKALPHRIHDVSNGDDALAFLRRSGSYATAPRPSLVVLDLNLPKKDGRELLRDLKKDQVLARIPVLVLSASGAADDVDLAYDLQANSYVKKPKDLAGLSEVVAWIERFWLKVASLPA